MNKNHSPTVEFEQDYIDLAYRLLQVHFHLDEVSGISKSWDENERKGNIGNRIRSNKFLTSLTDQDENGS